MSERVFMSAKQVFLFFRYNPNTSNGVDFDSLHKLNDLAYIDMMLKVLFNIANRFNLAVILKDPNMVRVTRKVKGSILFAPQVRVTLFRISLDHNNLPEYLGLSLRCFIAGNLFSISDLFFIVEKYIHVEQNGSIEEYLLTCNKVLMAMKHNDSKIPSIERKKIFKYIINRILTKNAFDRSEIQSLNAFWECSENAFKQTFKVGWQSYKNDITVEQRDRLKSQFNGKRRKFDLTEYRQAVDVEKQALNELIDIVKNTDISPNFNILKLAKQQFTGMF